MSRSLRHYLREPLFWILVVALIARLATAVFLGNEVSGLSGAHDEISYSMLGHRFATGYGMTFPENWYPWIQAGAPQSYYSYSISLLLAGIYFLFGYYPLIARLIFAVLGTGIVFMIFVIARRLYGRRVALLAAGMAAVYAYLVFYGVTLVTETPFILALLISIYVAMRIREEPTTKRWILLGVALAVTLLLRMAIVFFVPVLLLWTVWALPDRRQQFVRLLIPVGIVILAVLPFTLRNYRLWGEFMLLESQFGHVFWNGNHPGHEGDFHPYKVFPIPEEILASNNDAQITGELLRLGIRNVLADPLNFLQLTLTRLREFYMFWPTSDSTLAANLSRVFSFGILFPFTVVGMLLSLGRWRELLPVYLFVILHTGVYATSWTMIRYRIPLDAFFLMFAAYGICRIYEWRRPREVAVRSLSQPTT